MTPNAASSVPLFTAAVVHAALAVLFAGWLLVPGPRVGGAHRALKPFKFAASIAAFLFSMALVVPRLAVGEGLRGALAWLLVSTMVVEMAIIVRQARRGVASHFNMQTPPDARLWNLMMAAIVLAALAMIAVALLASTLPLGGDASAASVLAWRAGLWLLLLSPVTGFAMGGRSRHSVGGDDGGPGLPLVGWSVRHGDLRVSHFFSLHALQGLPLLALLLEHLGVSPLARLGAIIVAASLTTVVCVGTLVQAFAGRPFWRRSASS